MKRPRLLAVTLLAGAGIIFLLSRLTRPQVMYARGVSEFLAQGPSDRAVRVEGILVPHTLCRMGRECGFRFRMADSHAVKEDGTLASTPQSELSVRYDGCVVPDTFRGLAGIDMRITVEGTRCQHCHDFEATHVMAKCPGKYEAPRDAGAHHAASAPLPRCSTLVPAM